MDVCAAHAATNAPEIFTIGHSNQPMEKFLGLLTQHSVRSVVDSRSYPYSKYVPHFDRELLSASLKSIGVRYVYLGKELGGRPPEPEYYDEAGRVLYYRVAESERFKGGIARLLSESHESRVAVLCSEEDPSCCHRRLLITRVLVQHGVTVRHIRGSGELQAESKLSAEDRVPMQVSSLDHLHAATRKKLKMPDAFVLHSLRHTFLTRLGAAGVDAFVIMKTAGHHSVTVSQRYIHPHQSAVEIAVAKLEAFNTTQTQHGHRID